MSNLDFARFDFYLKIITFSFLGEMIMKKLLSVICAMVVASFVCAQTTNPKYNKALADSLGADDFGMKMYVMVILKTGPTKITDKALSDSLFAGHMANINRLVQEGKLIVAGPMNTNDKQYRGIFIFDMPLAETQDVLNTDPTIKNGLFDAEIYEWYGAAALRMYLEPQKKIEKLKH